MRGKDILAGQVYAVVKTRSYGCEERAVRARAEEQIVDSRWRVRFEEPMNVSHYSFEPVAKGTSVYRHPDYPLPVEEFELESRQLLALWDDNLAFITDKEQATATAKSRQEQEQEMVHAASADFIAAAASRQLVIGADSLSVSYRQVDKQQFRVAQLLLNAKEGEQLLALLGGRKARAKEQPLMQLAKELKEAVVVLGYDADDPRLQVGQSYVWRQNHPHQPWLQALLPTEVLGALATALVADDSKSGDGALAALLQPLLNN